MPHNLLVVDYGLGHPGSVHDAHAFLGTRIAQDPEAGGPGRKLHDGTVVIVFIMLQIVRY